MKKILFSLLIALLISSCNQGGHKRDEATNEKQAQTEITVSEPSEISEGNVHGIYGGCGYNHTPDETAITLYHPRPREINQINSILKFSGLSSNFKIYAANIDNAVATIIDNKRYILYDPKLLSNADQQSSSYWSSMSILAHEIGHHLSGHTITNKGSNPFDELEADQYSGFILYKLGASISQATQAIESLGSDKASMTHPAKADRIKAILKGWNEANQTRYNGAIPPPPSDKFPFSMANFSYEMFFNEENINTSDYFQSNKIQITDPEIYEGVILELDNKYDKYNSGDSEKAFQIIIQKIVRKSTWVNYKIYDTRFKLDDKVWIIYNNPTIQHTSMAHYRSFVDVVVPGRIVQFSSVWDGGNSVGYDRLNHIKVLDTE